MAILNVNISPELAKFVEEKIKETGLTHADIMRQALTLYAEDQAVRKVLLAAAEPSLEGNLDEL